MTVQRASTWKRLWAVIRTNRQPDIVLPYPCKKCGEPPEVSFKWVCASLRTKFVCECQTIRRKVHVCDDGICKKGFPCPIICGRIKKVKLKAEKTMVEWWNRRCGTLDLALLTFARAGIV